MSSVSGASSTERNIDLFATILEQDESRLAKLLDEGENPNQILDTGYHDAPTLLFIAVTQYFAGNDEKNLRIVRSLLQHGADIDKFMPKPLSFYTWLEEARVAKAIPQDKIQALLAVIQTPSADEMKERGS